VDDYSDTEPTALPNTPPRDATLREIDLLQNKLAAIIANAEIASLQADGAVLARLERILVAAWEASRALDKQARGLKPAPASLRPEAPRHHSRHRGPSADASPEAVARQPRTFGQRT
jgi:hypothetical protein